MIAYKVLRNKSEKLFSCQNFKKGVSIEYKLRIRNKPKIKGSLLIVFKTLKAAKIFKKIWINSPYEIWKVEIDKRNKLPICRLQVERELSNYLISLFWKGKRTFIGLALWPKNSVGAKWVKLIKKIPYEQIRPTIKPKS